MITTTRQLRILLDPWPVALTRGRYRWTTVSMGECERLKCFWHPYEGERISMKVAAKRLEKHWPGRHHAVSALEQRGVGTPWIITEKGIVIDGNHRLLALIRNSYKGPIIRIDYIHGSGKGDENIPKLRRRWARLRNEFYRNPE